MNEFYKTVRELEGNQLLKSFSRYVNYKKAQNGSPWAKFDSISYCCKRKVH